MKKKPKHDVSGYATKVGVKCSDGRTIMQDAFAHMDGVKVPLVYEHVHDNIQNVLGHAILENRKDGVYAYCSFNNTPAGQTAAELVKHGDVEALSIYANGLVEKSKNVTHGNIREVSLVLTGANPQAYIENLAFGHSDGTNTNSEDEVDICVHSASNDIGIEYPGSEDDEDDEDDDLSHSDKKSKKDSEETVGDILDTLNEKQKTVVFGLIGQVLAEESDEDDEGVSHSNFEGDKHMKKNLFDEKTEEKQKAGLDQAGLRAIFESAKKSTLKHAFQEAGYDTISDALADYENRDAVLAHSGTYGIDNIGYLFPDARTTTNTPAFIKRDTEWVSKVFGAAKHIPFSRIKTVVADITPDEARARGYVTGKKKEDEVFALLKRTTDPQTVYKKQKMDRDDIVDITDFDVIMWLKMEMRMMLEEEIARAQLVGDGRSVASNDKIKEDKIRPIATDDDLYTVEVQIAATATVAQTIDEIVKGRKKYKGSGTPDFFTTPDLNGDMLLLKDTTGRRLYNNETDLAAAVRARSIIEVPVMENKIVVITPATVTEDGLQKRLIGVSVNMLDYSLGADKGGNVAMYDDFDIDYNQFKYLIETRCSGALTMPHSAIAYWKLEVIPKTGE